MQAPNGVVAESPWEAKDIHLPYERLPFGDRWLLVTGKERDLIDKLTKNGRRLDDKALTTGIHQGLITSADHIYHLNGLARTDMKKSHLREPSEAALLILKTRS